MKTLSFENLQGLSQHKGGLKSSEVISQRNRFGYNDIVEVSGNPLWELFLETIQDPMIWFLVGIGSLFFITGQISDGITLYAAVIPLLLMDAFLHWRTQASTASLKGQLSSHVQVRRDSQEIQINSRELVPGDLVLISPGLLLPADGVFEEASDIQVDESALTGESFPVLKKRLYLNPFTSSREHEVTVPSEMMGSAGTRILTGRGSLRVLLTGQQTAYGEIVQSVAQMPHERTPLQKSIAHLVKVLIYAAGVLCFILALIRLFQGHGWLDALMSAATLAVAAIPEEFPVVFTFFLGVGIYRLAKKRALVRRAVSVENIGRVTQICTDKTGTITLGQLSLTHLDPAPLFNKDTLLQTALMASSSILDPLDQAIQVEAQKNKIIESDRIKTIPFTEDRKRETCFANLSNGTIRVYLKGAPETVLALSNLNPEETSQWKLRISEWARSGHKVIACAQIDLLANASLEEPSEEYQFCGLLAFEDPPRPEIREGMSYCHQNHIKVLMMTGDHPDTAAAIAKDSGLSQELPRVISAEDEPEKFQDSYLNQNPDFLKNFDAVARCTPLQKLKIVVALKKLGELVAVTGDGVNDVPALKSADIGIAMGERGTRSAKEVSSIILADDNFSTIVNAIREGRQLFKNLKMSFQYLLLIHIPLVLTASLIPLADYPLLYLPIHIVWLELIIHPTALLAFQSTASYEKAPDPGQKSFFSKLDFFKISIVGLFTTLIIGSEFIFELHEKTSDVNSARAKSIALLTVWSAFVTLYLTRFRSKMANTMALLTLLTSLGLIQFSDQLAFLHLSPLHLQDWIEIYLGAGASILILLLSKKIPSK